MRLIHEYEYQLLEVMKRKIKALQAMKSNGSVLVPISSVLPNEKYLGENNNDTEC
jgi:hypothetical protein